MQDKIIELLGRGIPATQVAAAVGCDDSYISQLLSNESIVAKVQELRVAHYSGYVELDKKVDSAEEAALKKVISLIPYLAKPTEAVQVYKVLNAAKRRTMDAASATQTPTQTVILDLPEAARVRFTLTHDKQVIEIAGRSMTTMPAKSLAAQLEQRTAARMLTSDIPSTLPYAGRMLVPSEIPLARKM